MLKDEAIKTMEQIGGQELLTGIQKRVDRGDFLYDDIEIIEKHPKLEKVVWLITGTTRYCFEDTGKYFGQQFILDGRTEKYLKTVRNNLCFVGQNSGHESIETTLQKNGIKFAKSEMKYSAFSKPWTMYEYIKPDGQGRRYAVESWDRTAIDDYEIFSYIFANRKPTADDIETIIIGEKIETEAMMARSLEFDCWECGHHRHILDQEGSLKDKWNAYKEQYCGC